MVRSILVLVGAVLLPTAGISEDVTLGVDRPVTLHVPPGYDPKVAAPLVLVLHAYGWSDSDMESAFLFTALSDELGFLLAYPYGCGYFATSPK